MSWFPIIVLALIAFVLAVFVLRLERRGWTLFAAVLVFGLAGYATQGAPEMPGAPKEGIAASKQEAGEAMVTARRALFNPDIQPPAYLVTSDGFARRGRYDDAAALLRGGLANNPSHAEGWLALANALVEHAEGQLTPAALYAYDKADKAAPGHPGIAYYLGVALLRSGRPGEARGVWADMLANAPEDATWREELEVRLQRLDAMLAQSGVQGPPAQSQAAEAPAGQPE